MSADVVMCIPASLVALVCVGLVADRWREVRTVLRQRRAAKSSDKGARRTRVTHQQVRP